MPLSSSPRATVVPRTSRGRPRSPWDVDLDPPWSSTHPDVLPRVVRPTDVGGYAAWQEMTRSGVLVPLWGECAAPAGHVPCAATRVEAVRHLVAAHTIVAGASAAWVHTGVAPPARLDVAYPAGVHRPPPLHGRTLRQVSVLRTELVEIDGVLVTGVQRTALEVATRRPRSEAVATIGLLVREHGLDVRAAARSLELRLRWAGRARAREVLAAVTSSGGSARPRLA